MAFSERTFVREPALLEQQQHSVFSSRFSGFHAQVFPKPRKNVCQKFVAIHDTWGEKSFLSGTREKPFFIYAKHHAIQFLCACRYGENAMLKLNYFYAVKKAFSRALWSSKEVKARSYCFHFGEMAPQTNIVMHTHIMGVIRVMTFCPGKNSGRMSRK